MKHTKHLMLCALITASQLFTISARSNSLPDNQAKSTSAANALARLAFEKNNLQFSTFQKAIAIQFRNVQEARNYANEMQVPAGVAAANMNSGSLTSGHDELNGVTFYWSHRLTRNKSTTTVTALFKPGSKCTTVEDFIALKLGESYPDYQMKRLGVHESSETRHHPAVPPRDLAILKRGKNAFISVYSMPDFPNCIDTLIVTNQGEPMPREKASSPSK